MYHRVNETTFRGSPVDFSLLELKRIPLKLKRKTPFKTSNTLFHSLNNSFSIHIHI